MKINFDVITIFPEMIEQVVQFGVLAQGIKNQLLTVNAYTPRIHTSDFHKTVDDRPYGGGDGMVMLYEPLNKSIQSLKKDSSKIIFTSPKGKKLDQKLVNRLAKEKHIIIISGRYAGIDERLLINHEIEEISLGDYVLSGGELASLVIIDTVARQIPGVLGDEKSATEDSFMNGLLEFPSFSRPQSVDDLSVPMVLLSGDHKKIENWRLMASLTITYLNRKDLFDEYIRQSTSTNIKVLENKIKDFVSSLSENDLKILKISNQLKEKLLGISL